MTSRPATSGEVPGWLAPLVGGSAATESRGRQESGMFGTLAQWFVSAMGERANSHMLAGAVVTLFTQAICIWLYTRWRDWWMYRSFYPGSRFLFFGDERLPVLAEERVSSQPDLERDSLLNMISQVLKNGVSATLISGTVGCGKTWLLCRAVRSLLAEGFGVVYLDVRPNSTPEEFTVQLAQAIGFRFQRPTSWIVRVTEWFFEQKWAGFIVSNDTDDGGDASNRGLSDWQRLTSAIERIAAAADRPPTLVIDNLQNLKVNKDEEDFCGNVLDWATWCAENETLRVVTALPCVPRVKAILGKNPHAEAALHIIQLPLLTPDEVSGYLEGLVPAPVVHRSRDARWKKWKKVNTLVGILESPLWCKKMWDLRRRLGRGWDDICATFQAEGARLLRQYEIKSVEQTDDEEDNVRRARVWRLLIKLSDMHEETRDGYPYPRRLLGDRAEKTVDALIEAAVISTCLLTGELRIRSPPLRYIVRVMAGANPNRRKGWRSGVTSPGIMTPCTPSLPDLENPDEELRRDFLESLDILDPEGVNLFLRAPRRWSMPGSPRSEDTPVQFPTSSRNSTTAQGADAREVTARLRESRRNSNRSQNGTPLSVSGEEMGGPSREVCFPQHLTKTCPDVPPGQVSGTPPAEGAELPRPTAIVPPAARRKSPPKGIIRTPRSPAPLGPTVGPMATSPPPVASVTVLPPLAGASPPSPPVA
eukprot:Hpha_TRINITY_DN7077_c0_g1::TRINITY_DN7077_c0_g1_i1::g.22856::m.22856